MGRSSDRDAALQALVYGLRNGDAVLPPEGRVAFLRARPHPDLLDLGDRLVCAQDFKPDAVALESAGFSAALSRTCGPEGEFAAVLLLPERQKLQTLADLARGMRLLRPGGTLIVSLPNDWGARRFEGLLADLAGEVGTFSKNHCRVFWAERSDNLSSEMLQEWSGHAELRQQSGGGFWTRPGVFSWEEPDRGSALLTTQLPERIGGAVADLGAGWGFLSDFVLRHFPQVRSLDLFEADRIALDCARRNLEATGSRARLTFHWADVGAGVGDRLFDYVVMNPPFHEGRRPDPLIGLRFIAAGVRALKPGGELWLVANRHLPYEGHLREALEQVELVAQDGAFKILRGTRGAAETRGKRIR